MSAVTPWRPYRVHAVDADDRRTPLEAHGVVVELGGGKEVWIDFAPHPAWAGELVMMTPSPENGVAFWTAGKSDTFEVAAGASNVLHVRVTRRISRKKKVANAAKPSKVKAAAKPSAQPRSRKR